MSSESEPLSTDQKIPHMIRKGAEKMLVQGTAGFVIGTAAGIILSRGRSAGARKVLAGLGAGAGMGSGWTQTSMEIDAFLSGEKN